MANQTGDTYVIRGTILIIDDEHIILEILSQTLEAEGYKVIVAGSSREGLKKLEDDLADLIISDVMMPDVDGVQLCNTIRHDPIYAGNNSMPIILMSAASVLNVVGRCKYEAFIAKPFDIDHVITLVGRLLA